MQRIAAVLTRADGSRLGSLFLTVHLDTNQASYGLRFERQMLSGPATVSAVTQNSGALHWVLAIPLTPPLCLDIDPETGGSFSYGTMTGTVDIDDKEASSFENQLTHSATTASPRHAAADPKLIVCNLL